MKIRERLIKFLNQSKIPDTKHWYKIHKHDKSNHRKHTVKYEDLCQ